MRRALLAGATGHLGRGLLRELKERGYWVRALARDPGKLAPVRHLADDVFVGDITVPDTLKGVCEGIEVVISTAGQSVSPKRRGDRASFYSIDLLGNRNLLSAALNASVGKLVYVSVFGHDRFGRLEYVRAHEEFVAEMRESGLDCAVVRPTAYFSVFRELYLPSARPPWAIVLGDGTKRINPIHEADLAVVCVDAVTDGRSDIEVGGPVTYTRREIAEMAFAALGRKPRIVHLPLRLASAVGRMIRPFDRRLSAVFAFGVATAKVDCIAPSAGLRTLEGYYEETALRFSRAPGPPSTT